MNTAFKIPKRKLADDSSHLHLLSPLSRLQHHVPSVKHGYGSRPGGNGGGVKRLHGRSLGPDNSRNFCNVVKSLLRIPAANHTAPSGSGGASGRGVTNGWRPKRTSDRLLQPEAAAVTSQQRETALPQHISINSIDSLAEIRAKNKPESPEALEHNSPEDESLSSAASGQSSSVSMTMRKRKSASSISTVMECKRQRLMLQEVKECQRAKWLAFKEKKHKKERKRPSEPIVLSSEEEEEEEIRISLIGQRNTEMNKVPPQQTPSFLQLDFTSIHVGLMEANTNGPMTVTETGILIPVKGAEDGEVTVVTSQLRGYGLYGGGVAKNASGASLLLLWVTDAQSNILHREIHNIRGETNTGPPCAVVLLVLKQLQDLQNGLLVSILDQYQNRNQNRCSSLNLTEGLLLVQRCPPPLDQHLLQLLGQSSKQTIEKRPRHVLKRMIQYPKAPCKGGITVTEEDLLCLNQGEFLNDVIIDFYLKYLTVEGGGASLKIHVFSSFFYKQLSRRRLDDDPSVPDRQLRHQRVKNWTRHVDIFDKHFLFVPINQESHWFLAIVCFPGLEKQQYEAFEAGYSKCGAETNVPQKTKSPMCTQQGCTRGSVLKRPCILIMDSLKLTNHNNVSHLLREYLQMEWECRRNTQRVFSQQNTPCTRCRVTLQDNSSDCGVYLLQYAQSFMQNPVVHFDLPPQLDDWFPRQRVRQKRQEISSLILSLRTDQ